MIYTIFRNNTKVTDVKPADSSELVQKKQTEDYIRLNFYLDSFVELRIGDYILWEKTNEFYYINKEPRCVESPANYYYECIFEGAIHQFKKTKVFLSTAKSETENYTDYKFPLTGNASTFLSFIVDNLQRNGYLITAGTADTTEVITIDFNNWNVFEAISEISSQLGIDWYLDAGVLHFSTPSTNNIHVFQVGRKSGFTSLTRVRIGNENIETVVFGYGSTANLPPRYADEGVTYDSELLTENRLSFSGVDGQSKLEKNVNTYGRIEQVKEFDDIKPTFTGSVEQTIDLSTFICTAVDFDIEEQKLSGIKPKVVFLTGKLIGLTFDISFDDTLKTITLDTYSDESGDYPNSLIGFEVGDEFSLFDLILPTSYITAAQTRLQEATQAYLDAQSVPKQYFEGAIDERYIAENNIVLNIGDLIRIISNAFGLDAFYEIKELVQNLNDLNKYTVKFGDIIPLSLVASLSAAAFSVQQEVYNIRSNSVTNNQVSNVTNVLGQDLEWQTL